MFLKVTSNNGSTGYTWVIDQESCAGILDITSGYVYYPAVDSFDVGYGEEIFTITATGFGQCAFRIAYAQAWTFTTFEEHIEENGYMI